jgi:hypothetical protein
VDACVTVELLPLDPLDPLDTFVDAVADVNAETIDGEVNLDLAAASTAL